MKFYNITDLPEFFKEVDKCEGNVYFCTEEGDRINLKSKISQFVAFSTFLKQPIIGELELVCDKAEDSVKLVKYMIGY